MIEDNEDVFKLTNPDPRSRVRVRAGKEAETVVQWHLDRSARKGVAVASFIATPHVIVGKSPKGHVVQYTERSTVDILGTLKGGRSIAAEVKSAHITRRVKGSIAPPRLPLDHIADH